MWKFYSLIAFSLLLESCNPFVTTNDTKDEFATLPQDEAIHPKNSLEWWYLTGFLYDQNKKEYGVEYVFFHFRPTDRKQRLMVNVAITTPEDSTFYYDYTIVTAKNNLKDSLPLAFEIPNYSWSGKLGDYRLKASMNNHEIGFNLKTKSTEPIILHQNKGYAQYGDIASAGYYSIPRIKTKGKLFLFGDSIPVYGELWYDRQWNCGGVTAKNVSWDWTAISFDNQTELMLFRVIEGNNKSVVYGGTYVNEKNEIIDISSDMVNIETSEYWKSSTTGKSYPMHWDIKIDSLGIDVVMKSVLNNQELRLKNWARSTIYWEGMCTVKGSIQENTVVGKSYLEMTNK